MIGLLSLTLDIASFRDVPILAEADRYKWLHDALEVINSFLFGGGFKVLVTFVVFYNGSEYRFHFFSRYIRVIG